MKAETKRQIYGTQPRKARQPGAGVPGWIHRLPAGIIRLRGKLCWTITGIMAAALFNLSPALAQKEVTADIGRYRDHEVSARSYERYEVSPRAHLPYAEALAPKGALVYTAPTAEKVRIRKYLPDAHWGLKFYERRTCIKCHPSQARGLHTVRERITCRQCHGREPIAGISHYYSPMNPRRRYAFICAKCHEGSSASFATYKVHPPNPSRLDTLKTFPLLFVVFWMMIALAAGTFVVFLPHTIAWGIREFFVKKEKTEVESPED